MRTGKRTITALLMTVLMIVATFSPAGAYAAQGKVAFNQSKSIGDVTVTVAADPGVLPDGAQLKVATLSAKQEAAANKAIDKVAGEAEVASQYNLDIKITDKEGDPIQPDTSKGKVNVYFESEKIADKDLQAEVFHIDGNKAEELDVAKKGDEAVVETDGFSPYVVRFTFLNGSTEKAFELLVGDSVNANTIAEAVGLSVHGDVTEVTSNTSHVTVSHSLEGYQVKAESGWSGTSNFALELRFSDGHQDNVRIRSHAHNWDLQLNEAKDKATLKCVTGDNDSCYYEGEFNETIAASDATYNGQQHGASLSGSMTGNQDFRVGTIHYASGHDVTTGGSTTAPTNAGKYTAYATITADQASGNKTTTIYKNYTIAKADINLTEATAKNLTYNGQDQELFNPASAKSATTEQTFTVSYRYSDSTSWKTNVLTGRNAGKYTIKYKVFGDANHNESEEKTLEVTIAQRAVVVTGVKANNKVYDGTKAATFECSNAAFENEVQGADLTVTAEGEFENRNAGDNKTVNITKYTLGGANAPNYFVSSESTFTAKANITPKTIKVHWEHPAELEYTAEAQAPEARFDFADEITSEDGKAFTGDKVEPVISGKATAVGEHRAEVTSLAGDDAGNYELNSGTYSVDIEYKIIPKKLTVDWSVIEKGYEAESLEPDWELAGFVGGETPEKSLTLEANPTDLVEGKAINAGTYKATVALSGETAGNYEITNPTSDFTITKAPLTVFAKGWIYYGEKVQTNDDIHDLQYDKEKITGFKGNDGVGVLEGDVIFNTNYSFLDDATGVNGAKYYLIPQFDKAANYEVTNAEGELTVYPKPVQLQWTHKHDGISEIVTGEQAFTYDGKVHTYSAEVTEDSYAKTPSGLPADTKITVALEGDIQRDAHVKHNRDKYYAKAVSLSNPNYSLEEVTSFDPEEKQDIATRSVDYTIDQRPVEFSWKPGEFTYNGNIQIPEQTIENLQIDDEGRKDDVFDVTVEVKQNSDPLEEARKDLSIEAGKYTVKAITLADKNYTLLSDPKDEESAPVETSSFDYKIAPRAIQLAWNPDPSEFTYNAETQKVSMAVTNYAENIDADTIGADSDQVAITNEGTWEAKDAGKYTASLKAIEKTGRSGNYIFEGVDHPWEIKKAPLTVTANDKTITYKQAPANNGVKYSGFKGSDTKEVIKGEPKYAYTYAKNGKPGNYKINVDAGKMTADNYYFVGKSGKLTVKDNVTKLVAKVKAKGAKKGVITWNKVTGAKSYTVYLSKCDTKKKHYKMKKVATVKGTKYTTKKLKKKTCYKFMVVANMKKGKVKSLESHFATGNVSGKYTNAKRLKVKKANVTLKKGKSFKLKCKVTKVKKKKKLNNHAKKFRYMSDNTQVAKVSKSGKITAVGKGWCRVYVQTVNGMWKVVNVNVK